MGLRGALESHNVGVTVICPGLVESEMADAAIGGLSLPSWLPIRPLATETAARKMIKAIACNVGVLVLREHAESGEFVIVPVRAQPRRLCQHECAIRMQSHIKGVDGIELAERARRSNRMNLGGVARAREILQQHLRRRIVPVCRPAVRRRLLIRLIIGRGARIA